MAALPSSKWGYHWLMIIESVSGTETGTAPDKHPSKGNGLQY